MLERKRVRPGAGRNGENPWDLPAAHAGRYSCHCVRIGVRLVGENQHSLVTCGMGARGSQRQQLVNSAVCHMKTLLLCNSVCGGRDQGTAFNGIPLIVLPQALLVVLAGQPFHTKLTIHRST